MPPGVHVTWVVPPLPAAPPFTAPPPPCDVPPIPADDVPPAPAEPPCDDVPPAPADDVPPLSREDVPPPSSDDAPPPSSDEVPPLSCDDVPPIPTDDVPPVPPTVGEPPLDDLAPPLDPAAPSVLWALPDPPNGPAPPNAPPPSMMPASPEGAPRWSGALPRHPTTPRNKHTREQNAHSLRRSMKDLSAIKRRVVRDQDLGRGAAARERHFHAAVPVRTRVGEPDEPRH